MALKRVYWAAALALILAAPALAQNAPNYNNSSGQRQSSSGVVLQRPDTGAFLGTTGSPLPITCVSGCSGGGGSGTNVNGSAYANTNAYNNTPAGGLVSTAAPTYAAGTAAPLNLNTGGALRVDASGATVPVSGAFFQATQPVSLASSPLPTGAATAALQTTGNTALGTINTTLGGLFPAGGSIGNTSFGISGALPAFGSTPTFNLGTLNGAATAAAQATGNTALSTINTTLGTPFQAGGSIANTAFGATQSGTWNVNNIAGTVSLPTGAATSALQTTGNTSLGTIATNTTGLATAAAQTTGNSSLSTIATNTGGIATGNGFLSTLAGTVVTPNNVNVICTSGCTGGGGGSGYSVVNGTTYNNTGTYQNVPGGMAVTTAAPTYTTGQASPLSGTTAGALRIDGSAVTQPVSGTFWQATQPVSGTVAATQSGTWNVTNISGTVSLPTGASTAANQSTANGSLATIATNSGTQATAAAQATQLTQETLINTRLGDISSPAAGSVNARLGSPFQAGGSIGNTAFGATKSGTWVLDGITGTISLPTGAATSANQSTEIGHLATLAGGVSAGVYQVNCVTGCSGGGGGSGYSVANASTYNNTGTYQNVPAGGLVSTSAPTYTTGQASPLNLTTGGALRVDNSANTQPVSGTFWQATQPVSGTVAATQSGTWNVTNVSGTVSLPTGAATAAKQPALGTAGTASSDVLSVQGIASGTPLISASTIANATSTLTRPANTTAYSAGDLIASNTTAGSIVVPSATVARISAGSVTIPRLRFWTSATSGWGGVNVQLDFWTAAPTFTNGDNGLYAVATGSASYVGTATVSFNQYGDGAAATATIADGPINLKLASGQALYWTPQILSIATPTSGQTFTVTIESVQN